MGSLDRVPLFSGADPGFFLGGGALVSRPFFGRIPVVLENRRSSQGRRGVRTPCTLPLDPPLILSDKIHVR